jgi:hypothetical protein
MIKAYSAFIYAFSEVTPPPPGTKTRIALPDGTVVTATVQTVEAATNFGSVFETQKDGYKAVLTMSNEDTEDLIV